MAETEVQAARLSLPALAALQQRQPLLAAQLMRNVAMHLAGRLRGLTVERSAWLARSAPRSGQHAPEPMEGSLAGAAGEPLDLPGLMAPESPDLPGKC